MFENLRRGRQAINFSAQVPKILDLKLSFKQIIIFHKLTLDAPGSFTPCTPIIDKHSFYQKLSSKVTDDNYSIT